MKRKFCIVGASGRSTTMYVESIVKEFNDTCELAGIYDINPGRARYVAHTYGADCPVFEDFDEMIATAKPDALIVVCMDVYHAPYVIKGLEYGLYVFTEKPMCINAEQVEAILEAEKKYGRRIGVCFNMRYYDTVLYIKNLLDTGVIGEIYSANMDWLLARPKVNSGHGASYYHRWNAEMEKSGGLLITKATHHFDVANWLIGQHPEKVSAFGQLRVYGPKNAPFKGERCHGCPHADECEFSWADHNDTDAVGMFYNNEKLDGYIVDSCVYRDAVNIYDSMAISVQYDGGCVLTYTESSAAAYEGWHFTLNGEKGRMEIACYAKGAGGLKPDEDFDFIRVIDMNNNVTTYPLPPAREGSHGGSDYDLRKVLFGGEEPSRPDQRASSIEGAYSVLLGAAANQSIAEGRIVTIREMLKDPTLLDRE